MLNSIINNDNFELFDDLFEPVLVVSNNEIIYSNKQADEEFGFFDKNYAHFFSENFISNIANYELFRKSFDSNITNEGLIYISQSELFQHYKVKVKPYFFSDKHFAIITFDSYSEKITRAMYQIAKLVNSNIELDSIFSDIHKIVDSIIDAKNLFIALYDENKNIISFPYFRDEVDEEFTIIDARDSGSLTADVIRTGKPLLISKEEMKKIYSDNKEAWGTLSEIWLGMPLKLGNKIIGAIAVQSYESKNIYSYDDIKIFEPLAEQIAVVIGKKLAEEELRYSEEKFKLSFVTSPDAIAINRLSDGMYVEINDGFTQLTGFTKEDVIGQSSYDINIWHDFSDRDKLVDGLKQNGFYKNLKAKFRLKNGKYKNALMSANIILLNNQLHILSVTRDIDELERARLQIEKLNIELEQRVLERTAQYHDAVEELQHEINKRNSVQNELERYQLELADALDNEKISNSLKSKFISMVSHEYRTPLTIIYTSTELLERYFVTNDSEKHHKQLERIRQSVNNMTQLLDNVLFIGRTDSNTIKTNKEIVNITEFLYTIIEEMKIIAGNLHAINFEYSDEEIWIETDKRIISQILTNLISNAIKYSKIGSPIEVEINNFQDFVKIGISDYGIGIPKEDYEMVYEHFYRGENVGTISGTGLGLSIVKRCVEALKGQMTFSSEKNVGTSFYIKLPKKI